MKISLFILIVFMFTIHSLFALAIPQQIKSGEDNFFGTESLVFRLNGIPFE